MRRYWNRPLGSKLIILGAIAFLASMLGPWTRVCVATADVGARKCGWTTGYEGSDFGIYAALFAVAILVFELLPVLWPRLSMRGWPTAVITAILGVGLALCTLVKLIEDNEFQTRWAWVGFAIALFVMLVALLRVRHRWGSGAATQSRLRPACRRVPTRPPPEPRAGRPSRLSCGDNIRGRPGLDVVGSPVEQRAEVAGRPRKSTGKQSKCEERSRTRRLAQLGQATSHPGSARGRDTGRQRSG